MTNFVETLINLLKSFWPFVIVDEYERGVFYFFGRAQHWNLKPGLYIYVPWFTDIVTVSVVPFPISTALLNITLKDGKTLGYNATAIVRVVDPWLALNSIDDYATSAVELLESKASEKLAEIDAARLDPSSRKRLITDLIKWIDAETRQYGVEVQAFRFPNFAVNQKAHRFLIDSAL